MGLVKLTLSPRPVRPEERDVVHSQNFLWSLRRPLIFLLLLLRLLPVGWSLLGSRAFLDCLSCRALCLHRYCLFHVLIQAGCVSQAFGSLLPGSFCGRLDVLFQASLDWPGSVFSGKPASSMSMSVEASFRVVSSLLAEGLLFMVERAGSLGKHKAFQLYCSFLACSSQRRNNQN